MGEQYHKCVGQFLKNRGQSPNFVGQFFNFVRQFPKKFLKISNVGQFPKVLEDNLLIF